MDRLEFPDLPVQLKSLQECVAWAAGCPVFWQDNSEGMMRKANQVWCELRLRTLAGIGTDEVRYGDAGDVPWPRTVVQAGLRDMNVQATFRSRQQNFADANVAWYAATRAQLRIRGEYPRQKFLKPVQMALLSPGTVLNMPFDRDWQDRAEDSAVLDMMLSIVVSDCDSAAFGSWIEHVKLTSNLKHTAAISLNSTLQLDDEVIP